MVPSHTPLPSQSQARPGLTGLTGEIRVGSGWHRQGKRLRLRVVGRHSKIALEAFRDAYHLYAPISFGELLRTTQTRRT